MLKKFILHNNNFEKFFNFLKLFIEIIAIIEIVVL